jgi:hypothetical protein
MSGILSQRWFDMFAMINLGPIIISMVVIAVLLALVVLGVVIAAVVAVRRSLARRAVGAAGRGPEPSLGSQHLRI